MPRFEVYKSSAILFNNSLDAKIVGLQLQEVSSSTAMMTSGHFSSMPLYKPKYGNVANERIARKIKDFFHLKYIWHLKHYLKIWILARDIKKTKSNEDNRLILQEELRRHNA